MAERMSSRAGSNRPDKAQFRAVVREIVNLQQERDSASAAVMHRFKAAKKAGFNTKALQKAIAARQEDPEVVAQEMADQIEYLHWSGVKIPGVQADLFADGERPTVDGLSEKERAEEERWTAEQKGYATGRAGGDRTGTNPYEAGSELYVEFDKGFLRGMEAIAREMGPDAAKPNKEKKLDRGPGRRSKDKGAENGPPKEDAAAAAGGEPAADGTDPGTVH